MALSDVDETSGVYCYCGVSTYVQDLHSANVYERTRARRRVGCGKLTGKSESSDGV